MSKIKPQVDIKSNSYLNSRFMLSKNVVLDNQLMDNHIGNLIKSRLKEIKQTQSWLAESCAVSDNAVAKWIRTGKVARENISKISAALNLPADTLLGNHVETIKNELERQLIFFFRNVKHDHQDDLLSFANNLYNIDNPNDRTANPANGKAKKEKV